jgi:hypothetical protein
MILMAYMDKLLMSFIVKCKLPIVKVKRINYISDIHGTEILRSEFKECPNSLKIKNVIFVIKHIRKL